MAEQVRTGAASPEGARRPGQAPEDDALRLELREAVRHHHVGDLSGASRILSRILERAPDHADALHLLGMIAAQRGEAELGARLLQRAVESRPDDAGLRSNLAGLLLDLGHAEEAARAAAPALDANPGHAGLHYNYGNAMRRLRDLPAAISAYRNALAANPHFLEAALNLAASLLDMGELREAERIARTAAAGAPGSAAAKLSLGCVLQAAGRHQEALKPLEEASAAGLGEARHRLGRGLLALGRLDEARRTLERAAQDMPASSDIRNDLGVVQLARDAAADAINRFREAIARNPNNAEAHANLAEALRRGGVLSPAVEHGELAARLAPLSPKAWLNLGAVLLDADRPGQAHAALSRSLALDPHSAEAECAYGSALEALGDVEGALEAYDRALALDEAFHMARFNRGLARLRLGDYAAGLADYEARRALKSFPRVESRAPEWQGEPLNGRTLLLYAEQGYGDTLQFARFATAIAAGGGRVVLACQAALASLLQGMEGVAAVVPAEAPLPPHDLIAPLMSVPYRLGTTLDTVPGHAPYVPQPAPMALDGTGTAALKVGMVWAGSAANRINRRRSCPLEALAPPAGIEGVTLYSLQVGPEAARLAEVPFGARVADLAPRLGDFRDAAAAIMALDLVVTIDTAAAHLAGALGRPVWAMLSKGGDWRYLEGRADSPWYPTMRLFRQPEAGDWTAVVEAVRTALIERLEGRGTTS
ncbi:MAG: tetratricopeptide repeat protein [Alphaproteobacteria bacterium]